MDSPVKEIEGIQPIANSERSSQKRKLEPDIPSPAPESYSSLREVPPRARFKQHRPRYPHLDSHSGQPPASVSTGTSSPATYPVPSPSTTAVSKDHEQHPVDAKLVSLLGQFHEIVAESSQSRIDAERECVEREYELDAQISELAEERDRAVKGNLEKEEKLKTLALELWESRKQLEHLQLQITREQEGRSDVDARLKELTEKNEQLGKQLSDVGKERQALSEALQQERWDAQEMVRQIVEGHKAANHELYEFFREHMTRKEREDEKDRQLWEIFAKGRYVPSFERAGPGTTATSLQKIVSQEDWTNWLGYISGERAYLLKRLRRRRRKTMEALEEQKTLNRKELEHISTAHEAIRKEFKKLLNEGTTTRTTSKETPKTTNTDSQHLLRGQRDAFQAHPEPKREEVRTPKLGGQEGYARPVHTETAPVKTKGALKEFQATAERQIALPVKVTLLLAQERRASENNSKELDKRARLLETEKKGSGDDLAEAAPRLKA